MAVKVIDRDGLLTARRALPSIKEQVPFMWKGKPATVTKEILNGEMVTYDLDLAPYRTSDPTQSALGEMMTTPAGLYNIIQKSVIDLELGRELVPLLYGALYQNMTDANFTEFVDMAPFIGAQVVFLEHLELGEVVMGTKKIGPKDTVPIITYAAGFEWTEDMVMYDKTWDITQNNRAMGEAYNALLNHIHLAPIIAYNYQAKNQTPAHVDATMTHIELIRATLRDALVNQSLDKNTDTRAPRRGSVLLANSSRRWDLEEALSRMVIEGTEYPALAGINTIILYDGWSVVVGDKTYTYGGVDPNKAYLIEPRKYFRELVKHDLRVDATEGDLKRLIEKVMVGRARRGVIASPPNAVEEITLPA